MASSLLARTVHFIATAATLLSGDLDQCLTPLNTTCEAGVAAVDAWARNLTASSSALDGNDPYLVLPSFDKSSPFVQMHPLGYSVNRLVFQHVMQWRVFASTPALLTQDQRDYDISSRDLIDLQSTELPLLLTNVAVPPSNSWSPYTVPVYFDARTGLAVLSIVNSNQPLNVPQVEATLGILNYIEQVNTLSGCGDRTTRPIDVYVRNRTSINNEDDENQPSQQQCWIPIIVYADTRTNFLTWLGPVVEYQHPPALIINVEEVIDEFAQLQKVGSSNSSSDDADVSTGVWVVSYEMDADVYVQLSIDIAMDGQTISNVTLQQRDMVSLPPEIKDDVYVQHQITLRQLANEAAQNDPIVGQSGFFPAQRDGSYRRCKAGECEAGNLFADAARWFTGADIAFQPSGGFRGPGWPAGDVRVSDIWSILPFDNTLCNGVISGVSLFKLFNYSLTYSTFEGENTQLGDRLLQVSGMRISYNLGLPSTRRLVAMEVWDPTSNSFKNVERLQVYTFTTDSYVCSGFVGYPELLSSETLVMENEVPGEIDDSIIIQAIVADYLSQLDGPYDSSIQGRLVNRTDNMESLNLIQTGDSCSPGEYWDESRFTCEVCPNKPTVAFLSAELDYEGEQSSDDTTMTESIDLVNAALFDVAVLVKSLPNWVSIASVAYEDSDRPADFSPGAAAVQLRSGETLKLSFQVNMSSLEPGTAQGTVAFGVLDGGKFPGCTGRDATFEIFARKYPPEDLHQLGSIRYVGWGLAGFAVIFALTLTCWVLYYQNLQVVRTLQPTFLVAISLGVLVMALALVPLGIDDEITSEKWCDVSCMSIPWLLSIGFTAAMSALCSKLWRINRLFKSAFRRIRISVKSAMVPFFVMFSLNFAALLTWTILSPLQWRRIEKDGEPWNSYGSCKSENETIGMVMTIIVTAVNAISLLFALYSAYVARDISDEFAESKSVGLALFCWMQLLVVAGPMLALIDSDNPAARYFLQSGVVFAVCVTMLCFIFGPVVWQKNRSALNAQTTSRDSQVSSWQGRSSANQNRNRKFSLREKEVHVSGLETNLEYNRALPVKSVSSLKDLAKQFHDLSSSDEGSSGNFRENFDMRPYSSNHSWDLSGQDIHQSHALDPVVEVDERASSTSLPPFNVADAQDDHADPDDSVRDSLTREEAWIPEDGDEESSRELARRIEMAPKQKVTNDEWSNF